MSFDLFLWDPPSPCSDDDVRARYERAGEGEEDDAEEADSLHVDALFRELTQAYPALEELADDHVDDSPWSASPARAERWVMLSIRWGDGGDKAVADVERLAQRHGLVLYDPQGDEVHWPNASPRHQ